MIAKKYTQEELENTLWAAADSSRGVVDGGVFKDYVLTFLFYKYMSDLHKAEVDKLAERYGNDQSRIEMKLKNSRFILPQGSSFHDIYKQQSADNIGELINKALHKIEDENSRLKGLFQAVDFNSESILGKTSQRNKMIRDLINDFAKIDLTEVNDDLLGNAYMYMIERFGTDAGKKAGEFFTPRQIAKVVARLANPIDGSRICDPTCGSGGLLLLAGEELEKRGSNNYALYGQEKTGSTYNLARMNMFLHGKDSARLEWGDTLNHPMLVENNQLMKFDVVIANPPFSLKKWGAENAASDPYNRFWRGIPPKDKGDFAFISHMVETAKAKEGKVVVIVPHGVLFRGGAEGIIRKSLLEDNLVDAVIGFPANLFQTASIPVAILVIDRSREVGGANEKKKDILFIEASREFKAEKAQNMLTNANIDKIVQTYFDRKEIEKFSRLVSFDEIKENDFNLNITRYVDTFEEEEAIDIKAVQAELVKVNQKLEIAEAKMKKHLEELGL